MSEQLDENAVITVEVRGTHIDEAIPDNTFE